MADEAAASAACPHLEMRSKCGQLQAGAYSLGFLGQLDIGGGKLPQQVEEGLTQFHDHLLPLGQHTVNCNINLGRFYSLSLVRDTY